MSEPVVSAYRSVPEALDEWEQYCDSPVTCVAGLPKRSVIATIMDMRLTEHTPLPAYAGECPYCHRDVQDIYWHLAKKHPEREAATAKGRQTRSAVYVMPDDHPVAEAVEAALVFIGRTRPDLYHVTVADRLWLVPRFQTGWDKVALRNPKHFEYIPKKTGEKEAAHKERLAIALGFGLRKYYTLIDQAHTAIGVYLDLNREHELVPA